MARSDRARSARRGGRRPRAARPRGKRARREAGQHQPRRQGGEGRPALRLRRARRRRRRQGPGRLRHRQGARGAGGDPQGDRAGQAPHDPRAAARGPHAASRRASATTAPARSSCARAVPGTGIIAGGPMRAIFEALGVQDVVAKSVGTSNPHNMMKATFAALTSCASPRSVAARRGKKVERDPRPRARPATARAARWRAESAIRWLQIGSPIGRQADQQDDAAGASVSTSCTAGACSSDTPDGARHDRQGAPHRASSRIRPPCAA